MSLVLFLDLGVNATLPSRLVQLPLGHLGQVTKVNISQSLPQNLLEFSLKRFAFGGLLVNRIPKTFTTLVRIDIYIQ